MNLLSLFDRPIAFHRPLVTITGSITAALMLSQAIYWSRRTTDDDGWFYKTLAEWEEETGMTRREQETARAKLRELGFIEEERRGMPARLYYRVNEGAILHALSAHGIWRSDCTKAPNKTARKRHASLHESAKQDCTKPTICLYRTETTTETTTESAREEASSREEPPETVSLREPAPSAPPAKPKTQRNESTFRQWLDVITATGERPVRDYQPLWEYCDRVGIPADWVAMAWEKFTDRYLHDPQYRNKRYKDWRHVFLNAIRDNWYGLWCVASDGSLALTGRGKMLVRELEVSHG